MHGACGRRPRWLRNRGRGMTVRVASPEMGSPSPGHLVPRAILRQMSQIW